MPTIDLRRRRDPKPDRRRALELLAASRDGCTESIMLAHGFTIEMLVELVRDGLASAHAESSSAVSGSRSLGCRSPTRETEPLEMCCE
jgi:hypothetical protein